MANTKLTPKQERFCEEYVIDLNGTQAAVRAGYSHKTAPQQAAENLIKPNVSLKIQELKAKISSNNGTLAQRVIAELEKLAFQNVKSFVNGDNHVLELKTLPDDKTAAVKGVKTTKTKEGDVTTELIFHSKDAALEKLGRHLGLFEKDNTQRQPIIPTTIGVEIIRPKED